MKKGLRSSILAASLASMTVMTGCSDSDSIAAIAKSFSITAVDGYIVKIITPATATCGTTVYSTDANTTVTLGELVFKGIGSKIGCQISVPADAIIDSDGDNKFTTADENNSIGYEMKADGNDTYVTQFTTLVQDYITAGDTTSANNLKAIIKDFNPVVSIADAAVSGTADQNASRAKAIQLMVLGEAIKTMKKSGAPASAMAKLDTATTITAITNKSTDVNVTAMTASLPATFKAAAKAKAAVIKTVAVALKTMKDNNTTNDVAKFIISISDGGKSVTAALSAASDLNSTQIAAVSDINTTALDTSVTAAKTLVTTATNNAPALVTLGGTLKIGDVSIALPGNGKFGTVEIDVSSSSKLADFSKIELPSITTTKGFTTQNVTLMAMATNSADSTDYAKITIGKNDSGAAQGMTLMPNDTNTSVKLSMVGAPIVVSLVKNGATATTFSTTSNTLTNTDFKFDICTLVGCTNEGNNSTISDLESFLQVPGKTYDINITITHSDNNVTFNYTEITGKITTK